MPLGLAPLLGYSVFMADNKKPKKKLKSIKSNLFSRSMAVSKWSLKAGAMATGKAVSKLTSKDGEALDKDHLIKQIGLMTNELGQLKGSLMKAGQMFSTYGEHLLPAEANELLKTLQKDSPPVDWTVLRKVLLKEFGSEIFDKLDIEEEATAAASLGQVHKAVVKKTGEVIALKIQYPGVDKSVDSDLAVLKKVLGFLSLVPSKASFESTFEEVRQMLYQEVDYTNEAVFLDKIAKYLKDDPRFVVPKCYKEFSGQKVLATSFEPGVAVDSKKVKNLSQERRNNLGLAYLELYLRELNDFKMMQTDPHLGNYSVRIDKDGNDQLILFDYGAVRFVPDKFHKKYKPMVAGSLLQDKDMVRKGALSLGILLDDDDSDLVDKFIDLCFMFTEPFSKPEWEMTDLMDKKGAYNWGESDLPTRVLDQAKGVITKFRLRTPPKELLFLDRKLGGTFTFLSVLGCNVNTRPLLEKWTL